MEGNQARSPAAPRETAKQRAARMSIDHYKSRDRLGRLRLILVIGAPLVALGWWFGGRLVLGDRARQWSSHGPVADAHAQWEFKCEVCHEPYVSATGERKVPFVPTSGPIGKVADAKCISCHKGPTHHQTAQPGLAVSCGSCHRDHRGRLTSLVDLPDSDCTRCHQNLTAVLKEGAEGDGYHATIKGFDTDHPDFSVRTKSVVNGKPRSIVLGQMASGGTFEPSAAGGGNPPPTAFGLKFTHSRHMMRGLGGEITYGDWTMTDAARKRYGLGKPSAADPTKQLELVDLVELRCADCHSMGDAATDRERLASGTEVASGGNTGAYYEPVRYELHCALCHELTIGSSRAGGEPIAVPHGPQPSEIETFVRRAYSAELLESNTAIQEVPVGDPGARADADEIRRGIKRLLEESTPPPGRGEATAPRIGAELTRVMRAAIPEIFKTRQTCAKCHAYQVASDGGPSPPDVIPTRPPEVWFPHGRFDHSAHRALKCAECHKDSDTWAKATPTEKRAFGPWESAAVMLPDIGNCRACHGPRDYDGGPTLVRGGVDYDCTECHRYHDGDSPLAGLGSLARGVDEADRRAVLDFVSGRSSNESGGVRSAKRETSP